MHRRCINIHITIGNVYDDYLRRKGVLWILWTKFLTKVLVVYGPNSKIGINLHISYFSQGGLGLGLGAEF